MLTKNKTDFKYYYFNDHHACRTVNLDPWFVFFPHKNMKYLGETLVAKHVHVLLDF